MLIRRPKGWWRWYHDALNALAQRAHEAAMVISDGDYKLASVVRSSVLARHYWREAGKNAKGQDVFFCWTIHKDEHGQYYTWREVHTLTEIKRYDRASRKKKAAVEEIARQRYNAFIERKPTSKPASEPQDSDDNLFAGWEDG